VVAPAELPNLENNKATGLVYYKELLLLPTEELGKGEVYYS
jgi:hypothetical protein